MDFFYLLTKKYILYMIDYRFYGKGIVMNDNICKFSPTRSIEEAINIINFVFETKSEFSKKFSITATYAIYLVTEGSGRLHTTQTDFGLKRGDLFFTMPSKPFYIENEENLQFIYITFFGWRATSLLERLNIIDSSPIPEDFSF